MSVVMAKVSSSAPGVTEPGKGDPQRFQTDSSEHRRVIFIDKAQADPLSNLSDFRILGRAPLKGDVANRSERDEAGGSLSKLPSTGKRKEPSSPLDDLLPDSSESSRAESPLAPRKVARISHAIKKVANPTKLSCEPSPEISSTSVYLSPYSKLRVT